MQSMIRALLVDDDEMVCAVLPSALLHRGIAADVVSDTQQAKISVGNKAIPPYDVLLLDVTMPGQSGLEFLEELRNSGDDTPVIMVTSDTAHSSRMRGFDLGADDYVTKPFEPDELAARINAVVRRTQRLPILQVKDLTIDVAHRSVLRGEDPIELSPREFDVFMALIEARGDTLSRQQLLEQIWDVHFEPGTAIVEVQIARLRKKVESGQHKVIETVKGSGYRITRD